MQISGGNFLLQIPLLNTPAIKNFLVLNRKKNYFFPSEFELIPLGYCCRYLEILGSNSEHRHIVMVQR